MKVPQEQNKTFYSTPPLFLNIDFTTTEKKKKKKNETIQDSNLDHNS